MALDELLVQICGDFLYDYEHAGVGVEEEKISYSNSTESGSEVEVVDEEELEGIPLMPSLNSKNKMPSELSEPMTPIGK